MSDLAISNVEALARDESGWGEYPNIFYQECSSCYDTYGHAGAFFYCNI